MWALEEVVGASATGPKAAVALLLDDPPDDSSELEHSMAAQRSFLLLYHQGACDHQGACA